MAPANNKKEKLAVVVGAGRSGLAAARLLAKLGYGVRLLEKKENSELAATAKNEGWEVIFGEHRPEDFRGATLVVPSPGVPVAFIEEFLPTKESAERPEVIGEMELSYRQINEPVIAITGTSGKTTTASICAKMLEAEGLKVFLGGNIGTPLAEYVLLGEKADVLVLEVSSFQLQTCVAFRPKVAMILNISENHLDYHKDMQEYEDAKFNIFFRQTGEDFAILPKEMQSDARVRALAAQKIFFTVSDNFRSTKLLGVHNQLNLEAAWQAAKIFGVTLATAQKAAAAFVPIEHRLEYLGEKNGITFVNDSKGTTVESLKVALTAMEQPVNLLVGGVFKGGDLAALLALIKEKVMRVAVFGASGDIFAKAWQDSVNMSFSPTLQDACNKVLKEAKKGEVVLLSPATASFDLYANYKARGNDFKRIVENLN